MAKLPPELNNLSYNSSLNSSASKGKRVNTSKEVSSEIRDLVIRSLKMGICDKKTASVTFNLPLPTIIKIYEDSISPEQPVAKKALILDNEKLEDDHLKFINHLLAENCKYTIKELREFLRQKFGLDISTKRISAGIPVFHYSFKRTNDIELTTITPEIMNDHKEYCELFLQLNISGRLLIYFDETGFEVTMRRFPGSKAQNVPPPSIRIRNKTIMTSMTPDELIYYKAIDGPSSNISLIEYLNDLFRILASRRIVGAVLIMGNATFAYHEEITEATQMAGHEVVFLPMCSSFINPIENMFSQWVSLIRSKKPSSEKELEALISSFNGVVGNEKCREYCNHCLDNARSCVTGRLIYAE